MTRALALVLLAACTPVPTSPDGSPLDVRRGVHASSPQAAVEAVGWRILAPAGSGCWSAVRTRSGDPAAVPVYGSPCASCSGGTCTVTGTPTP